MSKLQSTVNQEYKQYDPVHLHDLGADLLGGYYVKPLIFTAPPIPQASFTTINADLQLKITAANGGNTAAITDRDTYVKNTFMPAIDKLRRDVNTVSAGDKGTVEISGFHSTKIESATAAVGEKMEVNAEGGTAGSGTINYSSTTKVHASSIFVLVTPAGEVAVTQDGKKLTLTVNPAGKPVNIILINDTAKKGQVGGLLRGDDKEIRMLSVNPAGSSPISNKVSVLVP